MTTTQKNTMYAQILAHGENLNRIFNTGIDPVKLSKTLHSLEAKASKLATDYCNGDNGVDSENFDEKSKPILDKVSKILFSKYPELSKKNIVFLNGDCRGYALKIKDSFIRGNNYQIYTDWGGYGILAPDFTPNKD